MDTDGPASGNGPAKAAKRSRGRMALELVAMRGKDVVGVRHLLAGSRAWVGDVGDALARLPLADFGGQPLLVGEAHDGCYALNVPARARARMHGGDGMWRLLVGPDKILLHEGERAVLVLGAVQIRAQVVHVQMFAGGLKRVVEVAAWLAFVGAVYVAVVTACAALAPTTPGSSSTPEHRDSGGGVP